MTIGSIRTTFWFVLFFLVAPLALAAPVGEIVDMAGKVTIANPQQDAVSVKKGAGIEAGQTIATGSEGRAVIKFQDGQIIALKSNSVFKVGGYKFDQAYPENGESQFVLLQGGARAVTGLIGSRNKTGWRLATPSASMGVRGTDFVVAIQQGTYVKVTEGAVAVVNAGGTTIVTAGEAAAVTSASTSGSVVPASQLPAGIFSELDAINLTAH